MMNAKLTLDVEVNRVLYPPPATEGEFFVLLTDRTKCSGKMKWRPEKGERLRLEGEWTSYRGERNFKFSSAIPNVPVDPRDQLRYACDRAVGFGPVLEQLIWSAYADNWRAAEVGSVKGFTAVKSLALQEAVSAVDLEADKSQAIGWLMGKGATVNMATSAYEEWKKETIGVAQANPFRLADLPNYSFVDVDGSIREAFGIGMNDRRRIRAAIVYKLKKLTSGGSTVIDWNTLSFAVCELVGADLVKMVSDETAEMFEDKSLVGFSGSQSISLKDDYWAEINIWKFIKGHV